MSKQLKRRNRQQPRKPMQARSSERRYTQLNVLVNVAEHEAISNAAHEARLTMAEYVRRKALPSDFTQAERSRGAAKGGSPEPVRIAEAPSTDDSACDLLMSHEQRDEHERKLGNADAPSKQLRTITVQQVYDVIEAEANAWDAQHAEAQAGGSQPQTMAEQGANE